MARLISLFLSVGFVAASAVGCKPAVAPMVMSCEDDYRPASCLDGEEECETDDDGCRVCTCVRDDD